MYPWPVAIRSTRPLARSTLLALVLLTARARSEEPKSAGLDEPDPRAEWTPPLLHTLALFSVQRVAEAWLWPEPFARVDEFGKHYIDAFTKPPLFDPSRPAFQWDGDSAFLNVAGHGLMGSELYLRARTCSFGWAGSFAFAAGASAVWEYAFEGNGVRPSAQDLVYTPLAGMALGELRYFGWTRVRSEGASPKVRWLRYVLDPLGEFERALGSPC